ncbi:MAG TPA: MBL fold metallo-hydrolase [Alphaproteobacteria bacterium]|nr:MBL fold metallo-hydrolase [Alphaproteobacteria bacterium]
MPEVLVLGSAASVPDAEHDTVALAVRGAQGTILIDCGGSTLHKLARLGIARDEIRAVILTHHHADHVYGLPILVQGLWLGGRKADLPVHGPSHTLDVARQLLAPFNLLEREEMFTLRWHSVPLRDEQKVLEMGDWRVTASPAVHAGNDTIAVRFDVAGGGSFVYSADTEPAEAVVRLAAGADLLVHEATGDYAGHSSPEDAAEVARDAGVERLVLIHYPAVNTDLEAWRCRAANGFPGPVVLAQDGDVYPF